MEHIIDAERLARAKRAFTTRRVPGSDMRIVIAEPRRPSAGDLVLARVETIGHHRGLERPDGRKAHMYPGDEIVVCYGSRYAPHQFEAEIPDDLGPCDLVAAGGIAARVLSHHDRVKEPTRIVPVGVIGDRTGRPLNVASYALPPRVLDRPIPVIAVVGTSMNSGKTTTAAALVRGLTSQGYRVAGIKITGTGAGPDVWSMTDAGAQVVLDFTDAGYPSTYLAETDGIVRGALNLLAHAADAGCSVAVMEIADGLHQQETAAVLRSAALRSVIGGVLFACGAAMGAAAGQAWLEQAGHHVLGLSGRLCASPLAVREATAATGLPCFQPGDLWDGAVAASLLQAGDGQRAVV